MKRIFERIVFMLFGALLVSAAYLVGSIDKSADANPELTTLENVVVTGTLNVKGTILVGDQSAEHGNLVNIQADEIGASILLLHNRKKLNRDASVMLVAKKINGIPNASLKLQDNLGNTAVGAADLGFLKAK